MSNHTQLHFKEHDHFEGTKWRNEKKQAKRKPQVFETEGVQMNN